MAGRGNPSFLKNQKARKRVEQANAKRAARQARREEKANRAATRDAEGTPVEGAPAPDSPESTPGMKTPDEGETPA